jgi:predicted O-methyltransferase YrrM
MRKATDASEVVRALDNWVGKQGNGMYIPDQFLADEFYMQLMPSWGMQQSRQEIEQFVATIISQPWYHSQSSCLEIGLGYYGSSHMLWRMLFDSVTTLEIDHARCNQFGLAAHRYLGYPGLHDTRSKFVIGSSHSPQSLYKARLVCNNIQMLFIDGAHSYESALADWLLYSPLVAKGGIVAFNDIVLDDDNGGVPRLIDEMRRGDHGVIPTIHNILCADTVGIGYYIKD